MGDMADDFSFGGRCAPEGDEPFENLPQAEAPQSRSVNPLLCAGLPLLDDKFIKSVVGKYWDEPVPKDWDSPNYTCNMADIKQIIVLAIKEYVNMIKEKS